LSENILLILIQLVKLFLLINLALKLLHLGILLGADTSEISFSDNELENFSFSLKDDNIKVSYKYVNLVIKNK